MRESQLVSQLDSMAAADAHCRRGPFADPVDGQNGGVAVRRGEERAGGMGFVVLREDVPGFVSVVESPIQFPNDVQLLSKPEGQCLAEAEESTRRIGKIRLQQPLELGQWLLIERDVRQLVRLDSSLVKAVGDRTSREALVVLDTSEA